MTTLDDLPMFAAEAELIYIIARIGIPLRDAEQMELWEIAAAGGLHRVETQSARDEREVVQKKQEYWEATVDKRAEIMARRRERQAEKARR